jgi:uncharacterized protein (DUF1684 family)
MTATIKRTGAEQFAKQWREWHTQHEARIDDRHGFLAVTSITAYHGTPAYEPNPGWAVPGRYVPFQAPRPAEVGGAIDRIPLPPAENNLPAAVEAGEQIPNERA